MCGVLALLFWQLTAEHQVEPFHFRVDEPSCFPSIQDICFNKTRTNARANVFSKTTGQKTFDFRFVGPAVGADTVAMRIGGKG